MKHTFVIRVGFMVCELCLKGKKKENTFQRLRIDYRSVRMKAGRQGIRPLQ